MICEVSHLQLFSNCCDVGDFFKLYVLFSDFGFLVLRVLRPCLTLYALVIKVEYEL